MRGKSKGNLGVTVSGSAHISPTAPLSETKLRKHATLVRDDCLRVHFNTFKLLDRAF